MYSFWCPDSFSWIPNAPLCFLYSQLWIPDMQLWSTDAQLLIHGCSVMDPEMTRQMPKHANTATMAHLATRIDGMARADLAVNIKSSLCLIYKH